MNYKLANNNELKAAFILEDYKSALKYIKINKAYAIKKLKYIHRLSKNVKAKKKIKVKFRKFLKYQISYLTYDLFDSRWITKFEHLHSKLLRDLK